MYIMAFYKLAVYYSDMPITLKIPEIINTDNNVTCNFFAKWFWLYCNSKNYDKQNTIMITILYQWDVTKVL